MLTLRLWSTVALLGLALTGRAADLDRHVPGDTEQVIVINVKQILGSALIKKHALPEIEKQLKANKDLQTVQTLTGVDPLKDVTTLIVANTGTTGDKLTLIVRGTFDTDKIHKFAQAYAESKKDELKISKIGDRPLYENTKDGKSFYFAFVDGTTVVGSASKDHVTAAVEGKGGKANKDLVAALQGVDGKQSVWMAGLIPADIRQQFGKLDQGPVEALKKLKAFSGGVNVEENVAATLLLATGDKKAAEDLAKFGDATKGLLAFAAQSNEDLAPFVNELLKTLAFKSNQGDVGISFKLSEEIVAKAIKLVPKK